ncbi:MAG: hypothetical protein H6718_31635 [Polyangiaceae bacterium]|nr:hypothetical protein [Myxococcales bacterium]MCB9590009.1 hypothetical protein [Polyangiaceae bacterium]
MWLRDFGLAPLLALLLVGCGGGQPPAVPQGNDTAASGAGEAAEPVGAESDQSTSPPSEAEGGDDDADEDDEGVEIPDDEKPLEAGDDAARNKVYKMVPGGVDVSIDGLMFHIKAEAKRQGAGWGVVVKVKAESEGDATRYLMAPNAGPLAFATKVTQSEKVVTEIGDTREGEGSKTVGPDSPLDFERTWPPKGTKPLVGGQELELQVGLWGLGREIGKTRPVKGFVVVKVVAPKGRPAKAYVNPPS